MKIIISEEQQKLLLESKQIEQVQNLVDLVVDDYVDGCSKATAFSNLQLALCKGLKKGTTQVKVIDVKLIENKDSVKTDGKIYAVKLSIITDQEWFKRDNFTSFEIRLTDLIANIIGSYRYWFIATNVEVKDDQEMISESLEMDLRIRRRFSELEKIGDIIEYQTEIQDPCDFEDAEEYIDFCIGEGVSFYYCDENYCDEDDQEPSEEMVDMREEIEKYLEEKFHDYLLDIYNDLIEKC